MGLASLFVLSTLCFEAETVTFAILCHWSSLKGAKSHVPFVLHLIESRQRMMSLWMLNAVSSSWGLFFEAY